MNLKTLTIEQLLKDRPDLCRAIREGDTDDLFEIDIQGL